MPNPPNREYPYPATLRSSSNSSYTIPSRPLFSPKTVSLYAKYLLQKHYWWEPYIQKTPKGNVLNDLSL